MSKESEKQTGMTVALSVIILTKNEQEYIGRCVSSARWAEEVLVLDSGSTDATREIAAALGANIYEQEWLGWSQQHSRALELARNDWVLVIDSDEIVTPQLQRSILDVLRGPLDERDGYYVDRRGDFLGILLPNPHRPSRLRGMIRLFNRKHGRYDPDQIVHETVTVPGRALPLHGLLLHWRGFTMNEYIPQFNRYADQEARMLAEAGVRPNGLTIFMRPLLRFFWVYIVKREFRFGTRGLIHAMLKATSEYIRYAKLWEMQNAPRTIHPPAGLYLGTPAVGQEDSGAGEPSPTARPAEAGRRQQQTQEP